MKKLIIICLAVSFSVLVSCSTQNEVSSRKENTEKSASSLSSDSKLESVDNEQTDETSDIESGKVSESSSKEASTSSVASSENNNNISSATNNTSIPKTPSADTSSLVVSQDESKRGTMAIRNYFYDDSDSAEYKFLKFMAGVYTPRFEDVSKSNEIRDWAISQGKILIPREKNREIYHCEAYYEVYGNRSLFYVDTFGYKINSVYFRPLKKSEREMELKDLAKKYRFNNEDKMVKGKEKLKWGEYYTCVSTSKNECMYLIFRFDDYLITFNAPWKSFTELIEYDEMLERVEKLELKNIVFEEYFKDHFFLNKSSKIKDS